MKGCCYWLRLRPRAARQRAREHDAHHRAARGCGGRKLGTSAATGVELEGTRGHLGERSLPAVCEYAAVRAGGRVLCCLLCSVLRAPREYERLRTRRR